MPRIIRTIKKKPQPTELPRILIRQSRAHPNRYAFVFYDKDWKRVGITESKNGSYVEIGKIVHNFIKDGAIPADAITKPYEKP